MSLVTKYWKPNFYISAWINDIDEKYSFIVRGKRRGSTLMKILISKEQALEIIKTQNLLKIKDTTFKSGFDYCSQEYIDSEIERIQTILDEKMRDAQFITKLLEKYQSAK